ncbi:MAG: hypothetical protein ABI091_10675, partial [Ferruginibacter sp.]
RLALLRSLGYFDKGLHFHVPPATCGYILGQRARAHLPQPVLPGNIFNFNYGVCHGLFLVIV